MALIACGGADGVDSVASRAATSSPQPTVPAASTTTIPPATTPTIAGSSDDVPTTPSTTTPLPDADSVFHTLLANVPDDESSLALLLATNFERVADVFDIPDRTTDPENWISALSLDPDGPLTHSLLINTRNMDDRRAEVGFSTPDQLGEAVVQYGYEKLNVHLVDVDAATIDLAVRTDPAWSDVLIDAEVGGVPYYEWGEVDRSNEARSTATHDSALGGFMAVSDHVVLRTLDEDILVASLTLTPGQSLADNPDVALILDSFTKHQVYSMALTNDMPVLQHHGYDRLMLQPYRLLGTGQAFGNSQRQTVLAFVHDDQDSAIENAARLDTILRTEDGTKFVPYAERFANYEISVDGVLVTVLLNTGQSEGGFWSLSLLVEEPLYWAEIE